MSSRLRLTQTYSLRSLLGIAVIAVVLVGFYRYITVENLKTQETSFNVSIAGSLSATLWPYYAEFVREARFMPPEALAHTPQFQAMHREIADRMRGLRVLKVKIYDTEGFTVFSTDLAQIGEDNSDSEAFATAMSGQAVSELMPRGQFRAIGGVMEGIDVLTSYIPIRREASGPIEGGFEIFSDVTPMVKDIERTSYTILGGVTGLLLLLYGFLLVVVRRADRLIDCHEQDHLRRQHAKMEYLLRYDALTDLPNRSHFMALLSAAIDQARRDHSRLGIIHLSIDRFKFVNDSLGHEYGDRSLVEFARRLRECLGEEAVIARMGGDQFAVMSKALGAQRTARLCAERMIERASAPVQVNDHEIVLTASLGLAALGPGAEDAEQLVENAITAMRKAKKAGRNGFMFFSPDPDKRPQERLGVEMALRKALVQKQFVLHYQPRVDTRSGEISSLEALLRWRHPERGLVMPADFIPLLEDMDLMIPVGAWVLEEACRQTRAWQLAGYPDLGVSVNVSLRQFRDRSLLDSVRHALESSGLDSSSLELELTESVLADDIEKARTIVTNLKALGVNVAVDDFGTGYSSLSYLIHFPVSCLKVDRAFVTDLPGNARHAALSSAIAAMAASLGLYSVAEGVETQKQYEFLREQGYSEVQGFWIGAPCAAEDVPGLIADVAQRSIGLAPGPAGRYTRRSLRDRRAGTTRSRSGR